MKKKISYVIDFELTERNCYRWGINYFQGNNYEIDIFDVSALVFQKKIRAKGIQNKEYKSLRQINDLVQLSERLRLLKSEVILIAANLEDNSQVSECITREVSKKVKVFWLFLSPRNDDFTFFQNETVYWLIKKINFIKISGISSLMSQLRSVIREYFKAKSERNTLNMPYNHFSIESGLRNNSNSKRFKPSNRIYSHVLDWQQFLDEKPRNIELKNERRYALWVDAAIGNHSDSKLLNEQHNMNLELHHYYERLIKRLEELSEILALDIIIQRHPNSDPILTSFFPKKFEICYSNLSENIRNAEVVIAHDSTALGLATRLKKSIVLLNLRWDLVKNSEIFSKYFMLDTALLSLDTEVPQNFKLKPLNEYRYQTYMNNFFIHPESNGKNIWENIHENS